MAGEVSRDPRSGGALQVIASRNAIRKQLDKMTPKRNI